MKKTISTLLTTAMAITSLASCNKNDDQALAKTKTYVLIHGAWQAPYVWDAVKNDLMQKGNKVITVELPGHGSDNSPAHSLSMDVYRDKVVDAIIAVNEKVILVGHSMGGMVISAVAEKIPTRISKLVYIGAFLPANGQALADLANTDAGSKLGPFLIESPDRLTLDVKADSLTYLFINDSNAEAKQKIIDHYRAEPAIPFIGKVALTNENFGSVDKVYIKTLQDVVISTDLQDRMISKAGIKTIFSVNTGHSPFLSQPKAVSDLLSQIGQ